MDNLTIPVFADCTRTLPSMETVRQWKHSISWRSLLLLAVVALPMALLQVGRSPLVAGPATVSQSSLHVPVQVKLLWRFVELDTVQVFQITGEPTESQVTALRHAAARRVHSFLRVIAFALSMMAFVIFRKRLPFIQTVRLPMRRGLILVVGAAAVVPFE